jgi:hypothetical protein
LAVVFVREKSRRIIAGRHAEGGGANKRNPGNDATLQSELPRTVYLLVP